MIIRLAYSTALLLLAMAAVSYAITHTAPGDDGWQTGDTYTAVHHTEDDDAIQSLEDGPVRLPTVNTTTLTSPNHEEAIFEEFYFAVNGVKSNGTCTGDGTTACDVDGDCSGVGGTCDTTAGQKTKTEGRRMNVYNATRGETYGLWTDLYGAADNDIAGQHVRVYATGGSWTVGDEGGQIIRGTIQDYGRAAQGTIDDAILTGTQNVTVGISAIEENESVYIGERKQVVFVGQTEALTLNTAPDGTITSAGVLTGSFAAGPSVWLVASEGSAEVGWCLGSSASSYIDTNNDSFVQWLKITAVSAGSITTEWWSQGFDYGAPRSYKADTGAFEVFIAPCAEITGVNYDDWADQIIDSLDITKSGTWTASASDAFHIVAHGEHRIAGYKALTTKRLGGKDQGAAFLGVHSGNYVMAEGLRLQPGVNTFIDGDHAYSQGVRCVLDGCRVGFDYHYSSVNGGFTGDDMFAELDYDATDFSNGVEQDVFWITDDSTMNLTFDPDYGWGMNGDAFLLESDATVPRVDETETATSLWTFNPSGAGGLTNYDISIGDTDGTPTYGNLRLGNSTISRSSFAAGSIDIDGTMLFNNVGALGIGNDPGIEFMFIENGSTIRLAIPEGGADNATAMMRSVMVGYDTGALNNNIVSCDENSTYDSNIDCNTGVTGGDLLVQDDVEVEGTIYAHETINLEGATADGNHVILQVGADPGADVTISLPTTDGTLALTSQFLNRTVSTDTPGAGDACAVGDQWFESDAGIEWTAKDCTVSSEIWWGVQLALSP